MENKKQQRILKSSKTTHQTSKEVYEFIRTKEKSSVKFWWQMILVYIILIMFWIAVGFGYFLIWTKL